jgi:glycosyltransferase involved in cell wall biosynthesis
MRVALVTMETNRHVATTANRRFERLAYQLSQSGHEVTVFSTQWWEGDHASFEVNGIRYRRVTTDRSLLSFWLRLPYMLAKHNPDLIHTQPAPPQQVLAASFAGTLTRAPVVAEWFGEAELDDNSRLTRWAATKPDFVITPSEMVRTRVRELGAGDDRTLLIPESIDFSMVEDADPEEEIDVVYAHPLDESANIQSLLLGLAELRDRDWSATIIGDGPKRADYEQQAADLRIDDRINFAGACDRERRLSIYSGAHAFVQTAYREYFATELLWALASGCVGIVEYQAESSAHELIENYERSFRVTNPQQLADAIVDAGKFDRMTVDESWQGYDHDEVLQDYLDAYNRAVEEYGMF